jgi:saccharopine dehydrogenase-like NADP-dependent oxidoreductase|tara:strand:+ start:1208 stop:2560 length:1353 start_codon:yes stop_codon:yes gene_type:complete
MYLAPMKTILVLGAGRSCSSLIKRLLDRAEDCNWQVVVGDINGEVAANKVGGHPRGEAFTLSATDNVERDRRIAESDLVMSMVPAFLHVSVAKAAIAAGVPVITPSYVSPEMQALDAEAREAGVLILNEIGLDPGLDHMSAMQVIDGIKEKGGVMIGFESYCGGLVAPESDDNPWHYKISWNPRNVVLAGQGGSATFKDAGRIKLEPPHRVFRRLRPVEVDGRLYKGYPNRDSLSYMKTYGLEDVETLIRGTLRADGFCRSWDILVQMGMVRDDVVLSWPEGVSWSEWTRSFLPASTAAMTVSDAINKTVVSDHETNERLEWMGLFDTESGPSRVVGTPAQIIQDLIEEKWELRDGDRDMIVMWHRFEFEMDGKRQEITSEVALEGVDQTFTAMSDTVGLPMALAAEHMIDGPGFGRTGVDVPVSPVYYEPLLKKLEELGISFTEKHRYV